LAGAASLGRPAVISAKHMTRAAAIDFFIFNS
jgi:hypothetical protein